MELETVREYCLSLPMTTEDMAFGDDILLFRVCGKIYAAVAIDGNDRFVIKCDEAFALELQEHYPEIEPAHHWNKKYWIQFPLRSGIKSDFIKTLIRHTYVQVVGKLTKKMKSEYPEILTVKV